MIGEEQHSKDGVFTDDSEHKIDLVLNQEVELGVYFHTLIALVQERSQHLAHFPGCQDMAAIQPDRDMIGQCANFLLVSHTLQHFRNLGVIECVFVREIVHVYWKPGRIVNFAHQFAISGMLSSLSCYNAS